MSSIENYVSTMQLSECEDCRQLVPDNELIAHRGRFETHYYCRCCSGPINIYDDSLGDDY